MFALAGFILGIVILCLSARRGPVGGAAVVAYAIYAPVPIFASSFNELLGASIPAELITGCFMLLGAAAHWRVEGRPPVARGPVVFVALFMVLGTLTSSVRGVAYTEVLASLGWPMIWLAGILVGATLVGKARAIELIGLVCLPSAGLAIIGVVIQSNPWLSLFNVEQFNDVIFANSGFRPTGSMVHPLVAGSVFTLLALMMLASKPDRYKMMMAAFVIAAVCTVSRSALIGLVVAGVISVALSETRRRGSLLITLVGGVVVIALAVQLSALSDVYQERVLSGPGDQSVRQAGYAYILNQVSSDVGSLAFGHGYSQSQIIAATQSNILAVYRTFDNQLIAWLIDYGFLIVGASIVAIGATLYGSPVGRRMAPVVVAGFAMMQFANLMQFVPYAMLYAVCLGMLGAGGNRNARGRGLRSTQLAGTSSRTRGYSHDRRRRVGSNSNHGV